MNRPTLPFFAIIVLTVLGGVFVGSVGGFFYFLSSPDAASKANFAIANIVNSRTAPVIHSFYLRTLKNPDKDNDGLEDDIAEKSIYKTNFRSYDSQKSGISDGKYIYDVYVEAIKNNDEATLSMFRQKAGLHKGEDTSLEGVFSTRGLQMYNFYIGSLIELRDPLRQAEKYQAEGKITESVKFLEALLVEHPNDPLVLYNIGRAHHKLKDYSKALSIYMDIVNNPAVKSPLLYYDIAAANDGLGNKDLYVQYLERSIDEFPEELQQYLTLASHFEQKNFLDKAIEVISKGIIVEPRYVAFYNFLAIIAGKKNDHKTEFLLYEKAIAQDFRYTSGHHNLSILYEQYYRDLESALIEARIAHELEPDNMRYIARLVLLYSRLGNSEKSLELETMLLKRGDLDSGANNSLGLKYLYSQKYTQAESYFLKEIELSIDIKNTHNNLGTIYALLNDFALAEKYFKKAIEIDPLYSNPHHNLGSIYMNRGMQNNNDSSDIMKAKIWFEKALELLEDRQDSHQSLGRAYLKLDHFFNKEYLLLAEKHLLRAIELNSKEGLSYAELGYVYYNLGEFTNAKKQWEIAKSLGFTASDMEQRLLEVK